MNIAATPDISDAKVPAENSIEMNFRKREAEFQRILEAERREKEAALRRAEELEAKVHGGKSSPSDDDELESDPHVSAVKKALGKWEQGLSKNVESLVEKKAKELMKKREEEDFFVRAKDFSEVMKQESVQRLFEEYPDVAENLNNMPNNFDRQKLVYSTLKSFGLDKPKEQRKSSMQEKVEQNRSNPYYQGGGYSQSGYGSPSDTSEAGMKSAHEYISKLKGKLSL